VAAINETHELFNRIRFWIFGIKARYWREKISFDIDNVIYHSNAENFFVKKSKKIASVILTSLLHFGFLSLSLDLVSLISNFEAKCIKESETVDDDAWNGSFKILLAGWANLVLISTAFLSWFFWVTRDFCIIENLMLRLFQKLFLGFL
jgi:hypothetical protein